jgi:hypothetical protein
MVSEKMADSEISANRKDSNKRKVMVFWVLIFIV